RCGQIHKKGKAMKTSWRIEITQLLLIAAMFIAGALVWPHVPDRIPVHWNLYGQPDRMGGKLEALFLLPAIACGIYLLLLVIPRFDPGRENYENFIDAYNKIRVAVMFFMAVTYGFLVSVALGYRPPVAVMVLLPMGLLFIVLGNYMGKLRPN